MTIQIQSSVRMIKLSRPTVFVSVLSSFDDSDTLTLPAGTEVQYERRDCGDHYTHVATYLTPDQGLAYESVIRTPKLDVPAPQVAPAVVVPAAPVINEEPTEPEWADAPIAEVAPVIQPRRMVLYRTRNGSTMRCTVVSGGMDQARLELAPANWAPHDGTFFAMPERCVALTEHDTGWTMPEEYAAAATTNQEHNCNTQHSQVLPESPIDTLMSFLADSFTFAVGMGLKRPMIRLIANGRRYKVYLSKNRNLCIKTGAVHPGTSDPVGDEEYLGCLVRGRLLVSDRRELLPEDRQFLEQMAADPVGYMAARSKDMDRCCYCPQPLEDPCSKAVGYGPICAGRYGLPWGNATSEKVPSFAQLWQHSPADDQNGIRGVCKAIRQNPQDDLNWQVLGDLLEQNGYTKRPTKPEKDVRVPAV